MMFLCFDVLDAQLSICRAICMIQIIRARITSVMGNTHSEKHPMCNSSISFDQYKPEYTIMPKSLATYASSLYPESVNPHGPTTQLPRPSVQYQYATGSVTVITSIATIGCWVIKIREADPTARGRLRAN